MKNLTSNHSGIQNPLQLLIVDHHSIFRMGLRSVFEKFKWPHLISEAADLLSSMSMIKQSTFDILMVDASLPGMQVDTYFQATRRMNPKMNIMAFSSQFNLELLQKMKALGAKAFLLKSTPPNEVLRAVSKVVSGSNFLTYPERQLSYNGSKLTVRELEILQLLARHCSSREIADTLHLSKHTVDNHRKNMLRKTGQKNTQALIAWGLVRGHIHDPL